MNKNFARNSKNQSAEIQILARYDFIADFELLDDNGGDGMDDVLETIRDVIEDDFTNEVQLVFQNSVDVRIERLESGSVIGTIVLIMTTGASIYGFIALYKDFYESLVLLRQHLRSILDKVFRRLSRQRQGRYKTITVTLTRVPVFNTISHPNLQGPEPPSLYSKAFFWYLLFMNLVLTTVIVALVYQAVVNTYFKTP